ncbi:DUF2281 domain-containing protein [Nodosilinea sp. P-1105]|uniref:DUF2281 domain-containing protein n=1 Tax=Nodosilinea sp. P-1105 TaxID=2546229 RepID=UPI00146EC65B|nr:DUF2281 domain-containing protein [Nodosilinea sp. P-1105]NMF83773.1 DUF2281 domain-containing protein [Nodosilinea sp. P-1105]
MTEKNVSELHSKPVTSAKPTKRRIPGTAKDQIIMSPDFNEPLEDFKEILS